MWCNSIINSSNLKKSVIKKRLKQLELFAIKELECKNTTKCVNVNWVSKILSKIDDIWYNGQLLTKIKQEYGKLYIRLVVKEKQISGYVLMTHNNTKMGLYLNKKLFDSLFNKEETKAIGYHVGGLLCKDSLKCLLHVILHETIHMVLTVCEKMGKYKDTNHHGDDFQRITRYLFGHTNAKHGLILGLDHMFDLETIKKSIRIDDIVKIWIKNKWLPGKVIKINDKKAIVQINKEDVYSVDMGLVKIFPTFVEK